MTNQVNNLPQINFTTNLQQLMRHTKITSVNLAESIGVSAELIGKLKNGSLSNPSLKVLAGLSQHFAISIDELVYGNLAHGIGKQSIKPLRHISVVEWDKINEWNKEKSAKTIAIEAKIHQEVFALYTDDDYGIFPENSFILIDTTLTPKTNDYVLVLNKDNSLGSIKKLIIDDYTYLQSILLEVASTTQYNSKEQTILGVVIGYQTTKFFKCYKG